MDPSQLLLWFAGLSSLSMLAAARGRRGGDVGWVVLAVVILGLCASGLVVGFGLAGWLAGGVWLPLVAAPLVAFRLATRAASQLRYARAQRFATVAAVLHPTAQQRVFPRIFGALARIQRGEREAGLTTLRELAREDPMAARALAQVELRWQALVETVASARGGGGQLPLETVVRAFGEVGEVDGMLSVYGFSVARGRPRPPSIDATAAAFAGRPDLVEALHDGVLADEPATQRALRLAAAHQVAGEYEQAQQLLAPLAEDADHLVRHVARDRLVHPLAPLPLRPLTPATRVALHGLEAHVRDIAATGTIWHPRRRPRPWATWGILLLLAGFFVAEIPGGTMDELNLARLGAVLMGVPDAFRPYPGGGEWWRVVTGGLLHFGFLHIALNGAALWLFGRFLEPVLGPVRYALGYFVSGTLALATLVAYAAWTHAPQELLVGASASVMGLVGVTVGVLGLRYRRRPSPIIKRQLVVLASVVLLQVAFDAMTPMVSGGAHLLGFGYGLLFGLAFAPRAAQPRYASGSSSSASIQR